MAGEVGFTLTEADYVAANRDWMRGVILQRRVVIRYLILTLAAFLLGMVGAQVFSRHPDWGERLFCGLVGAIYVILVLGIILAVSYLRMPSRAGRLFRQQATLRKPLSIAWSEDGVVYRSANGDGTYAWSDFHCWADARSAILIYHTDNLFYIVPHRAISAAERADIIDLLTRYGPLRR